MSSDPSRPHTSEDARTEAQLWELNNMSNQLRGKLDAMIEEQKLRVEEFTARQHSLSSLPAMAELPQIPAAPAPAVYYPQQPQKPLPPALPPQAQATAYAIPQAEQPEPQPVAQPAPQRNRATPPPLTRVKRTAQAAAPTPAPAPVPRHTRPAKPAKKEESSGCSWIGAIVIFIIVLILRNCG